MERLKKPWFSFHPSEESRPKLDQVLRVNHPDGSYAGVGELNSPEEASLICRTLNEAINSDCHVESRWLEYFCGN